MSKKKCILLILFDLLIICSCRIYHEQDFPISIIEVIEVEIKSNLELKLSGFFLKTFESLDFNLTKLWAK